MFIDDYLNNISFGLGVLSTEDYLLLESNNQIIEWFGKIDFPASIISVIPSINKKRLDSVISKSRVYRLVHSIQYAGAQVNVNLSFKKIITPDDVIVLLMEAQLDLKKAELDALISSYEVTMGNYKKEILNQENKIIQVNKDRETLLSSINEKLEQKVVKRTAELEKIKLDLSFQATHDTLTGLANRRLYNDRLEHALSLTLRQHSTLAVIYIDLDKFKPINDTYGHQVGDELLIHVAERLKIHCRESDTVARLGGDEFSMLIENTNQKDIENMVKKIQQDLKRPYLINKLSIRIDSSIGIFISDNKLTDTKSIIQAADAAMYKIKNSGKGAYLFFSDEMIVEQNIRNQLLSDMEQAIDNEQFFLVYQPKIDLKLGTVSGVEALIRWQHPIQGIVSPDVFIPLAEESGLISTIGYWVQKTAIKQISDWNDRNIPISSVAINMSNHELKNPTLVNDFLALMASIPVNSKSLEFELTESSLMENSSTESLKFLELLKSCGHPVAIDDFGTGYSSLSYLTYLPVTTLKIDRSFVDAMSHSEKQKGLVKMILSIAKTMGLKSVAEGIETKEQLDFLILNGCDVGQGYYFAKPLDSISCEKFALELSQKI